MSTDEEKNIVVTRGIPRGPSSRPDEWSSDHSRGSEGLDPGWQFNSGAGRKSGNNQTPRVASHKRRRLVSAGKDREQAEAEADAQAAQAAQAAAHATAEAQARAMAEVHAHAERERVVAAHRQALETLPKAHLTKNRSSLRSTPTIRRSCPLCWRRKYSLLRLLQSLTASLC